MDIIAWLLEGDSAIRYLTHRDILRSPLEVLEKAKQESMERGPVRRYLDLVDSYTGMWGGGVYSPKHTSTHYTLLDLTCLGIDYKDPSYQRGISILLEHMWPSHDNAKWTGHQDMCVAAMVLRMNCYGHSQSIKIKEIVDYILSHQFADGGWNCSWRRKPAPMHSSLHTTLSVLEAFQIYKENGYRYRLEEFEKQAKQGVGFILKKRLFRSERTGEIINEDFVKWPFPSGWRYNIMRSLDVFRLLEVPYDKRMEDAIKYLLDHADEHGRLKTSSYQPGLRHFTYESRKEYSRYNTYKLTAIMQTYGNSFRHGLTVSEKEI